MPKKNTHVMCQQAVLFAISLHFVSPLVTLLDRTLDCCRLCRGDQSQEAQEDACKEAEVFLRSCPFSTRKVPRTDTIAEGPQTALASVQSI